MKLTRWSFGLLALSLVTVPTAADAQKALRQRSTLPLVISKSGSYILRSNITVPNANTTAIHIVEPASDVTIDLNGFTISGPTVCSGSPPALVCTPTGTGVGILKEDGFDPFASGSIVVKNGTIRGMGSDGLRLVVRQVRVEGVHAYSNGGHGIQVAGFNSLSRNIAGGNGLAGIYTGGPGVLRDNVAERNNEEGIHTSGDSVVSGNVAFSNATLGLYVENSDAGRGNVVTENVANANLAGGLTVLGQSVVSHNAAAENAGAGISANGAIHGNAAAENGVVGEEWGLFAGAGSAVSGNSATGNLIGITTEGGSTVAQNAAWGNTSYGFDFDADGYALNVASSNNGGDANPQVDGGQEMGTNLCGVDMSCP